MLVCLKVIYMQGIYWFFFRCECFDFWQKEFEQIGMQEIDGMELYVDQFFGNVFGYQDCYWEYKEYFFSVIGEFCSLLNYWYFGREFLQVFELNVSFINCILFWCVFVDQIQDYLWVMVNYKMVVCWMVWKGLQNRVL